MKFAPYKKITDNTVRQAYGRLDRVMSWRRTICSCPGLALARILSNFVVAGTCVDFFIHEKRNARHSIIPGRIGRPDNAAKL